MAEGRYPDKEFFWAIAFTIVPEWAQSYSKQVIDARVGKGNNNFANKKVLMVTPVWMERLQ